LKKIIISRTDSIGDVILTLPVAGVLKQRFPDCRIFFLGKSYTRPIVEACAHVDEFMDWDEVANSRQSAVSSQDLKSKIQYPVSSIQHLRAIKADAILHIFPVKEICNAAKQAGIPLRIGTSHRWYNWLYCNKLLHFSRKNSDLHEAQLNLKMLEGLGIRKEWRLEEIPGLYGLRTSLPGPLPSRGGGEGGGAFNLILHPKSKGSAREWGLDNFSRLIDLLPQEKFKIIITGTAEERTLMHEFLRKHEKRITDMTGKVTLSELINLIDESDGLVAASTGPLHIAAALGKHAIGLYAPMKPIWPKRWAPVGVNAGYLCLDKKCNACKHSGDCECIRNVRPEDVALKLEQASAKLF
jgi:heptosyltransferase III